MAYASLDVDVLQDMVPQDDAQLWQWIWRIWNVKIPYKRCCRGHTPPFEALAEAYFAVSPVSIWIGSRAFSGKSLTLACLALTEQVTLGAQVSLVGGSKEQSKRVHDYITGADPGAAGMFWAAPHAPRHKIAGELLQTMSRTVNGGLLRVHTSSPKSLRHAHPSRLRCDEADEVDLELIDMAIPMVIGKDGVKPQIVFSGTHHHPDGTMTELLKRAERSGWSVHRWCWRDTVEPHGWLKQAEVEFKKRVTAQHVWRVEIELGEPGTKGRVFDEETLANLFDPALGVMDEDEGDFLEAVFWKPEDGVPFVAHGADWGKRAHRTVLTTIGGWSGDEDAVWTLLCWRSFTRMPWPDTIGLWNMQVNSYGGEGVHDVVGVGDVIDDFLECAADGFDSRSTSARTAVLTRAVTAIQQGRYVFPDVAPLKRVFKYLTVGDLANTSHLPDEFASFAYAHHARGFGGVGIAWVQ
jgi:hypothetical protein